MNQPLMTGPEYLQSEEGKAFARKFLADLLLPSKEQSAGKTTLGEFDTLLHEYIEHLAQDMREYQELTAEEEAELKTALTEIYQERFTGFYPDRGADVYIMQLTRLARWLAAFTCEAWLIATGHRPSVYRPLPSVGTPVRAMHLYWAREAFGWWLSCLSKLPYMIKIQRIPQRGMASQLLAIVAGDPKLSRAVERMCAGAIVEVDDGCPLC